MLSVTAWCKSRSRMAVAMIRSPNTSPQAPKLWLEVRVIGPRSYRREISWKRDRRRIERHLSEARLLPGKTLENFDFDAVPMVSKAQVSALCAGDSWLESGANLILFGPPGGGKSHLASAIGLALLEKGWRVLFARTSDLVQKLQVARRELALEAALSRLERFDLLILDDIAYVSCVFQRS
jgi:DNA replication protein DnaC